MEIGQSAAHGTDSNPPPGQSRPEGSSPVVSSHSKSGSRPFSLGTFPLADGAVFLAILTGLVYICGAVYRINYFRRIGVPVDVTQLPIATVLFASINPFLWIAVGLLIVYLIVSCVNFLNPKIAEFFSGPPVVHKLVTFCAVIMVMIGVSIFLGKHAGSRFLRNNDKLSSEFITKGETITGMRFVGIYGDRAIFIREDGAKVVECGIYLASDIEYIGLHPE